MVGAARLTSVGRIGTILSLGACALLLRPSLAYAEPVAGGSEVVSGAAKEHARKLFEEGLELEKKADYVAAIAKYREAELITTTAGLRFHEGYCLEMAGKLTAARDAYEAADGLAREQGKLDVRAAVEARLTPLGARIPRLLLRIVTPTSAPEVLLDGALGGASLQEGEGLGVDPGEHRVRVRARGFKTFARKVNVPAGETTRVDVVLEPDVTDAASPAASVATPAGPRRRSIALPIATTAGALALAAGGIAAFVVAASAQEEGRRACAGRTSCNDDDRTRVRTFDALALAGFAGAVGLGVASVVLWASPDRPAEARPSRSVRAVVTPASLHLEGRF